MPTQRRLPLSFAPEVEIELLHKAFKRLSPAAQKVGFEMALMNRAMVIGLRRMAESSNSRLNLKRGKGRG